MHMLRKTREMQGYTVNVKEGAIGRVKAFYFDELTWTIRYIAVDTGAHLRKGPTLVSPIAVTAIDDAARTLRLQIDEVRIAQAPSIDLSLPISRRYEARFHRYYGWPAYWDGEERWGAYSFPMDLRLPGMTLACTSWSAIGDADSCIRSGGALEGFEVQAGDGAVGRTEDLIFHDETWEVRYIVVDADEWLRGKRTLISPHWLEQVDWAGKKLIVDFSREAVRQAPVYDPVSVITRRQEHKLFDHYGREGDWDSVWIGRKLQETAKK